ncbi:PREDICTED: U3 small nucleolar RNA-associated protein 15 homolog [Dinoponera quadriceps]|uniref:U3 small nucleolar RNA-associated protein 15 homolog n=1 Tax=Dinoponera quadriceps TaxID=609295 RepID=A0A6P3X612_DINQU|nr:PREDICTED: U3 small nucleolar RNA-associated protein 15 homolog [Dinoponera quadriceps]
MFYRKISTKLLPRPGPELTEDNIYWSKYAPPVLVKEFGSIDYIDFSPVEPYNFAVTCSVRLQVYNPITKLVMKTFSRFKETAYGGSFRKDGTLLCAGGDESVVRLFNINSTNTVRLFSGHEAAVHRAFFTADDVHIASFSDDNTTKLWDISSEQQVISFKDHIDYVRAGAVSPVSPDVILSGGYDKHIHMYDTRMNKKILSVNNDASVESLLFLPTGGIFLSAGGTDIKVFDVFAGGRLLAKITQHHNTVTCLQIASNGRRIMSGSLDGHVKIYDTGTYNTLHTLNYSNVILSLGISANDQTIVAGMADGLLSVRTRENEKDTKDVRDAKDAREERDNGLVEDELYKNASDISRVPNVSGSKRQISKEVLCKHDVYLRKFQYSKALDCVMIPFTVNKNPQITIALMQELIRRQGLKRALSGRDDKSLVTIIRFLNKYIGSVRYGRVLVQVANALLDVYGDSLHKLGEEPLKMFTIMEKKLQEEWQLMVTLAQMDGALQMIMSAGENTPATVRKTQSMEPSNAAQTERDFVLNIT